MSRTLEGLFELTRRLSRALDLPRALLPELQKQGHRQVCRARRGGPRTPSKTVDANRLFVRFEQTLNQGFRQLFLTVS